MSDVLMDWPSPDVTVRRRRRQLVVALLVLAVVTLVAATALVHGFDIVSRADSLAQLAADGYPTYPDPCPSCDAGFSLPLPDWRALSIWALAMGAAAVGWIARRTL